MNTGGFISLAYVVSAELTRKLMSGLTPYVILLI